jgi:hypothetical protein
MLCLIARNFSGNRGQRVGFYNPLQAGKDHKPIQDDQMSFEKIAQHVAQIHVLAKLTQIFFLSKKAVQNSDYFRRPIGENLPHLVTLNSSQAEKS